MDDSLLAEFQSTFMIGGDVLTVQGPVPHYTLYKQKGGVFGNQELRRKRLLEEQKTRRRNYADYARKVVEGELSEEEEEMEEGAFDEVDSGTAAEEQSDKQNGKPKRCVKKKKNPYRNQLMLSEWMVDVPQDFHEKWQFVVCPIGRRCLVIASRGTTSAYSRTGQLFNNFPSLLPGGCAHTFRNLRKDYSILDCIFDDRSQTFHVLDIMCWSGYPVYDSDTEFRMFWKETKLREKGEKLSKYSRINPLTFHNLAYHPCSREKLCEVLASKWPVEVDGLLFIHKEAHYIPCSSPLSAWLKPHMIPDVLKIPVSQEFLSCAPTLPPATTSTSTGKEKDKRHTKQKSEKMDLTPSAAEDGVTITTNH